MQRNHPIVLHITPNQIIIRKRHGVLQVHVNKNQVQIILKALILFSHDTGMPCTVYGENGVSRQPHLFHFHYLTKLGLLLVRMKHVLMAVRWKWNFALFRAVQDQEIPGLLPLWYRKLLYSVCRRPCFSAIRNRPAVLDISKVRPYDPSRRIAAEIRPPHVTNTVR